MLVIHYKKFYDGLIQPLCAALKIKRIGKDPTTTYQLGMFVNCMIHRIVEKILHDICMQTHEAIILYKYVTIMSDEQFENMPSQFQLQYRKIADEIRSKYTDIFPNYLRNLSRGEDQVLVMLSNYVMSCRNITSFLDSVRHCDCMNIEHHYRKGIPM